MPSIKMEILGRVQMDAINVIAKREGFSLPRKSVSNIARMKQVLNINQEILGHVQMGAINAAAWRRRSLTMAKYFLPEWFVHPLKVSKFLGSVPASIHGFVSM